MPHFEKENIRLVAPYLDRQNLHVLKSVCPAFFHYMATNHTESNIVCEKRLPLTPENNDIKKFALSPDGSILITISDVTPCEYILAFLNIKTSTSYTSSEIVKTPPERRVHTHPVFSRDGKYLLTLNTFFYDNNRKSTRLQVWSVNDKNFSQFASICIDEADFGDSILFLNNTDFCLQTKTNFLFYSIDPLSQSLKKAGQQVKADNSHCSFSPDQTKIAHIKRDQKSHYFCIQSLIVDPSKAFNPEPQQWIATTYPIQIARFLPDNQHIALLSTVDEITTVHILNCDTSVEVKNISFTGIGFKNIIFMDPNTVLLHKDKQLETINLTTRNRVTLFTGDHFKFNLLSNKVTVLIQHEVKPEANGSQSKPIQVVELTPSALTHKFAPPKLECASEEPEKPESNLPRP